MKHGLLARFTYGVAILLLIGCEPSSPDRVASASATRTAEATIMSSSVPLTISLYESDPCSTPCWQNFIPGETTKQEAIELIDTQRLNANCPLINEIGIHCGSTIGIRFNKAGTHVEKIMIFELTPTTLGEVIEAMGDPALVYIGTDSLEPENPEGLGITIYFPDRGLWLFFYQFGFDCKIDPNMEVLLAEYWSPNFDYSTADVAHPGYFGMWGASELEWQGYGVYCSD